MTPPVLYTIVSANYLAYAITLMQSLRDQHPESPRYVFLADESRTDLGLDPDLFNLVPVRECGIPSFEHFAFRYSVLELNTAVKPFAMRWLASRHGNETIAYVDPDILVISPLLEVVRLTDSGALAVLTPHITAPIADDKHPDEITFLRVGTYNLGFIATGPHPSRDALIEWWCDRLEHHAYVDLEAGLFTDQKWADLMPALFPDVEVLRHPGYDLAYWNLAQRPVTQRADGSLLAAGETISFVHFSGVRVSQPDVFSVHQNRFDARSIGGLRPLYLKYLSLLEENGYERYSGIPYAWARMRDGTEITPEMRAIFRHRYDVGRSDAAKDPMALGRKAFQEDVSAVSRLSRFLLRSYPTIRSIGPLRWAINRLGPQARWTVRRFLTTRSTAPELLAAAAARARSIGYETTRPTGLESVPRANVIGYFKGEFGVAEAGRRLLSAAKAGGVEVALVNIDAADTARAADDRLVSEFGVHTPYPVNVLCVNADQTPQVMARLGASATSDKHNIGLWFWELSRFPEAWRESLDLVDEVWTATDFVTRSVAAATTKPVRTVRIPIDATPSRKYSRGEFGLEEEPFTFLFTFDFNSFVHRKNPAGVVGAFQRAFQRGDVRTRLVLKSTNGDRNPAAVADLKEAIAGDDRVQMLDGYMTRDQVFGLQSVADSYVSLHRSEGFGLGLAESMFQAKPVIGTAYSGNLEFMDGSNSCLVGYRLVDVGAGEYPHPEAQVWADPDLDEAAFHMRRLVDRPDYAAAIGSRARERLLREFSPEAVGARIIASLRKSRAL